MTVDAESLERIRQRALSAMDSSDGVLRAIGIDTLRLVQEYDSIRARSAKVEAAARDAVLCAEQLARRLSRETACLPPIATDEEREVAR